MTIREMLNSLDNYCHPTNTQVEHNDAKLMQSYNAKDPIATLFERFDECKAIAQANGTPFSDAQLVQKFITLMEKTGVYDDQLEEWTQLPPNKRTWQKAKAYWLKKHRARHNRPSNTMQAAGYHNPFANLADDDST